MPARGDQVSKIGRRWEGLPIEEQVRELRMQLVVHEVLLTAAFAGLRTAGVDVIAGDPASRRLTSSRKVAPSGGARWGRTSVQRTSVQGARAHGEPE